MIYIFLYLALEAINQLIAVGESVKIIFNFIFAFIAAYVAGIKIIYPILAINIILFGYLFYLLYQIALPADENAKYINVVINNKSIIFKLSIALILGCFAGYGVGQYKKNA